MPRVGFEPMIQVFERVKTVHALDRAATVIGIVSFNSKFHTIAITGNLIAQRYG
jgi:hypothetical protein